MAAAAPPDSPIAAFEALGKPVFILTTDLHNSFAIKITDRVWEFASGPPNSNHVPRDDEGNRPATGLFQSGPRVCDIRWSSYILPDLERRSGRIHVTVSCR